MVPCDWSSKSKSEKVFCSFKVGGKRLWTKKSPSLIEQTEMSRNHISFYLVLLILLLIPKCFADWLDEKWVAMMIQLKLHMQKLTDLPLDVCGVEMFLEEWFDDGTDDWHLPAGHVGIMQQDQEFVHHVESVHDVSILLTTTKNKLIIRCASTANRHNMFPVTFYAWLKNRKWAMCFTSLYAALNLNHNNLKSEAYNVPWWLQDFIQMI